MRNLAEQGVTDTPQVLLAAPATGIAPRDQLISEQGAVEVLAT